MKAYVILLVDDQKFIRFAYSKELEKEGFKVISLESGEKAIEFLTEHDVHLVLLDAIMLGLNGFDTCKKIRALEKSSKIPVIFLTANADKNTVIQAIQAGGNDFALKSSDSSQLIEKIYKILEN